MSDHPVRPALYQKILVPMDGSPKAEEALNQAVQLASAFQSEVHLLLAYSFGSALFLDNSEDGLPVDLRKLKEHQRKHVEKYLEKQKENVRTSEAGANLSLVHAAVPDDPREAICQYATDHQIDLIVMNSRGSSSWTKWLVGSIAEQVLRTAPCPVLILRDPIVDSPDS
jgi:nucleotide-binding universal stress UspA family protein